jgi:hypothetical protein
MKNQYLFKRFAICQFCHGFIGLRDPFRHPRKPPQLPPNQRYAATCRIPLQITPSRPFSPGL